MRVVFKLPQSFSFSHLQISTQSSLFLGTPPHTIGKSCALFYAPIYGVVFLHSICHDYNFHLFGWYFRCVSL